MHEPLEKEKSLENLLESLIRMLGRSNEKVDDLSKRVNQLEMSLRETKFAEKAPNPKIYSFVAEPQKTAPAASAKASRQTYLINR